MFTSIDKALTALIMAVLYVINAFSGINFGLDEKTISTFIVGITPILIYLVPNRNYVYRAPVEKP